VLQREIVRSALEAGAAMSEPGSITDLDLRWCHDDWKSAPMSWSRRGERRRDMGTIAEADGGDSRTERSSEPRYQNDADRWAAEATGWDEQCRTCLGLPDPG
jgi:hypothetical protein